MISGPELSAASALVLALGVRVNRARVVPGFGHSFLLANRKSCGHAASRDEAKAFRAENKVWQSRAV